MAGELNRLGVATCRAKPGIQEDDRPLLEALSGIEVTIAPWDDPDVRWSEHDAVLIRSAWDYHLRAGEFVAWATALESSGTAVWNSASLVRWNAHKTYLREVRAAGLPTVPTVWLEGGDVARFQEAIAACGWAEVVIKPVVGASSYLTWRSTAAEALERTDRLRGLAEHGGALLQPFVPEIQTAGEWSVMFFGGSFSHAVRKRASQGEFRVQDEFGGTVERDQPPEEVLGVCRASLEVAPGEALYARVDGIETADGFVLGEIELIEPVLFLGYSPGASRRFADAVLERWQRGRAETR